MLGNQSLSFMNHCLSLLNKVNKNVVVIFTTVRPKLYMHKFQPMITSQFLMS